MTKAEASLAPLTGGKAVLKLSGKSEDNLEKPLKPSERETLLNIIGVMLELVQSPKQGRNSDAAIIKEMIDNYGKKRSIKKSTLDYLL